jgi:hypothetical protein
MGTERDVAGRAACSKVVQNDFSSRTRDPMGEAKDVTIANLHEFTSAQAAEISRLRDCLYRLKASLIGQRSAVAACLVAWIDDALGGGK